MEKKGWRLVDPPPPRNEVYGGWCFVTSTIEQIREFSEIFRGFDPTFDCSRAGLLNLRTISSLCSSAEGGDKSKADRRKEKTSFTRSL